MSKYRIVEMYHAFYVQKRRWIPWLWKTFCRQTDYEIIWEKDVDDDYCQCFSLMEAAEEALTSIIKFKPKSITTVKREYR